jgi:DNA segregation ATPase FtsK/SpoIIIE, S-DNA-T family
MAGERHALLVATDTYIDPGLNELRAPAGDVCALGDVLGDASIGAFDVRQLINRSTDHVKQEIEGFFEDALLQGLLLLYISGHGVLFKARRLYFATASTTLKRLRATAIEDGFVNEVMQHSRARSIVLVLDCCHERRVRQRPCP